MPRMPLLPHACKVVWLLLLLSRCSGQNESAPEQDTSTNSSVENATSVLEDNSTTPVEQTATEPEPEPTITVFGEANESVAHLPEALREQVLATQAILNTNSNDTLDAMVTRIENGLVENSFCWGSGLGPVGDFVTMEAKVGGCMLDKAEVIAMQWNMSGNSSAPGLQPPSFYRGLSLDLAACCADTGRRGWCIDKLSPAYDELLKLANLLEETVDDVFVTDKDISEDLTAVFDTVSKAAAELFSEIQEDFSSRAGLLVSSCPSKCTANDMELIKVALSFSPNPALTGSS